MIEKTLLLVGSPKVEQSTSASLGNYLISKLEEAGMTSKTLFIHRVVNREEKIKNLLDEVETADLIILTFPLYVDSLPAPVIKAMELIKDNRISLNSKKHQNFVAIANNGFPEASQNNTALKICRIFSRECGFIWKGGIAVGGGGTINGVPLLEKPGMFRNFIRGLDLVAQALKDDKEIPQEAYDFMSKKLIPDSIYRFVGNYGWRSQAKQYGVKQEMKQKPYLN